MKYLKIYEEFVQSKQEVEVEKRPKLSDKTIDDVLKPDFFETDYDRDEYYIDSRGVITIKKWNQY